MRRRLWLVLTMVACLIAVFVVASPALAGKPAAAKPTRVLIVVMDQMRPEYAQQFDMTNVLWLENHGIDFNKAYVGDMAAETVVSHNVMVSGLLPKHMGWSDEAFRDVNNVTGYGDPAFGANGIVTSGDLGTPSTRSSSSRLNYPKLGDYLHASGPSRRSSAPERRLSGRVDGRVQRRLLGPYGLEEDPERDDRTVHRRSSRQLPGPSRELPSYIASDNRFKISSGNTGDTTAPTSIGHRTCIRRTAAWRSAPTPGTRAATVGWPTPL